MDLTDRQRKLLFAGLVVVLAAVGIYLTIPNGDDGTERTNNRAATATPTAPPPVPSTPPPGINRSVDPQSFDIYRLLPFSQREFATAADIGQRFIAEYGTYRYDEKPQDYMARLGGFITDELRSTMEIDVSAPGVLEERRQQQIVASSTATLDGIRDIEANSIVFLVTGKQQVTKNGAESRPSKQYAVTVERNGNLWRVYAFEESNVGQAGDTQ